MQLVIFCECATAYMTPGQHQCPVVLLATKIMGPDAKMHMKGSSMTWPVLACYAVCGDPVAVVLCAAAAVSGAVR